MTKSEEKRLQIDGPNEKVIGLGSIPDKLRTFGLEVFQINGHDFQSLEGAFEIARRTMWRPLSVTPWWCSWATSVPRPPKS